MRIHSRFDDVGKDATDGVAEGVMVFRENGSVGGFDHGRMFTMFTVAMGIVGAIHGAGCDEAESLSAITQARQKTTV
jgi:hypothetical protein